MSKNASGYKKTTRIVHGAAKTPRRECRQQGGALPAVAAPLRCLLQKGDEVVAHTLLYGCTHSLFTNWYPKLGIKVRRVDFTDAKAVARAVNSRTRARYLESPVNPT